jgi:hypothetical protein
MAMKDHEKPVWALYAWLAGWITYDSWMWVKYGDGTALVVGVTLEVALWIWIYRRAEKRAIYRQRVLEDAVEEHDRRQQALRAMRGEKDPPE